METYCFGLCKRVRQENRIVNEDDLDENKPKHQYAMGYKDLEDLKKKFDEATDVLKRQMRDKEKRE